MNKQKFISFSILYTFRNPQPVLEGSKWRFFYKSTGWEAQCTDVNVIYLNTKAELDILKVRQI